MTQARLYELVINRTQEHLHVDVVNGATKTSVNIMPRKRVDLPLGYTVSPNWIALNPKAVIVHPATPAVVTPVSTSSTTSSKEATVTTTTASTVAE
jgi:hypothetical protein